MKIEQLFDPATSTYSYLLWHEKTKQAALIDSVKEQVERDTLLIRQLELNLKYTLDDETTVHPGHDYNGFTSSTIGREKAFNPRLGNNKSEQAFIAIMDALIHEPPARIDIAVPGNLQCGLDAN